MSELSNLENELENVSNLVEENIVNITYGRDVGYKIEQETFYDAIHNISATKIRKNLGFSK